MQPPTYDEARVNEDPVADIAMAADELNIMAVPGDQAADLAEVADESDIMGLPVRSRRRLPGWAKRANEVMSMPLFTYADKMHVHAISATLWLLGSYGVLFTGLCRELTMDDWSAFAELDAPTAALLASGIAMAGTGFPLLPKKHFRSFQAGMRNGMLSAALGAWMAAGFAMEPASLPPHLVEASILVARLGIVTMAVDYLIDKQPWDQRPVIEDLKLKMPPEASLNAATFLSVLWEGSVLCGLAHLALADGTAGVTDLHDPTTRAFAAQLAVGLAATPTIEAFFVGTLLQKDRFCKPSGKHFFCRELPDGEFGVRLAVQLPLQILFSFPGPAAMTVLLALTTGHADAVRSYFFLP